ncbi:ABC transporter substrate-binding protein [Streptomyces sp. NBC_00038]|uniref:ABC transporter substrate-binding protein n=1 Tax=Streptomyces sp. NBC_00038 TaxID=2903615 RepID=UPI00224DE8F7|nr:ABC transporter substrate-binding protein [Streptomyces sp. NBC_00038]MCX5563477.1 ABC transporter substrate-binding protein [Streptomyces sp. NBC_00038]
MRRLLIAASSAAALLLTVTACGSEDSSSSAAAAPTGCTPKVAKSDLVKAGTLTISTNATLPPMQYLDASNKIVGMRVDLGNEIAKLLCLTPKFVNIPFDAQIPGVQSGRWDMIDTGMFYTPERAETIKLVPYEIQGVSVSVAKGNPKKITSEDDLSGKTIAVEAPGYEFDTLTALNKELKAAGKSQITIRSFTTTADAYQALSAGQVEGVAIVESVTSYYQKDGRFETAVAGMNPAPLALGFGKDKPAEAVAEALNTLRDNGYLAKLFKEYGVTSYTGDLKVTTGAISAK